MSQAFEAITEEQGGILDVCENAFDNAYVLHSAGNDFITMVGDAETIRLHSEGEVRDIILGRPHLRAIVSRGIAFWVDQINTSLDTLDHQKLLVALDTDPDNLYETDFEGDPVGLANPEETIEIISHISRSQPIPLHIDTF